MMSPPSSQLNSVRHTAHERRKALSAWLYERWQHDGLTTSEIVDVSGIYDGMQGRYDKCRSDLLHLKRWDLVECRGRPARWHRVHATA